MITWETNERPYGTGRVRGTNQGGIMCDYSKMTQDEFDTVLSEIMDEAPASHLLSIPGVYEAVSEEFNNVVLDKWRESQS